MVQTKSASRGTRAMALSAGLCLLLAACGGGGDDETEPSSSGSAPPPIAAPAPAPTPAPTPAPIPTLPAGTQACGDMNALLAAINAARAEARVCENGGSTLPAVAPLKWNTALAAAAQRHSIDMAQNNHFSHTGTDGSSAGARISDAGYNATAWGENIAAGYGSVSEVMAGWLDSPGHCRNIMSANYADFGASCVYRSNTTYRSYWTTDFGRTSR